MKKILLLLLVSTLGYAQPQTATPDDLVTCDDNNDGVATFDLTMNEMQVLGGLNPAEYSITFYETLEGATTGESPIEFPQNYTNLANVDSQTIFIRVEENNVPDNFSVESFAIMVNPAPVLPDNIMVYSCGGVFDLTTAIEETSYTLVFYATLSDALAQVNPIVQPESYTGEGSIYITVTSIDGCNATTEIQLVSGMSLSAEIVSEGDTVTILATGVPALTYQIDNLAPQPSNVFYNISYGEHTIRVTDSCGNIYVITYLVLPAAPAPEPDQTVVEGDTLADVIIYGADIQWYADAEGTIPLSPETVIVAGVTYYATQTIDGYESAAYPYAVSGFAGIDNLNKNTFTAYPNPVTDILTISATTGIDTVEIYNLLGELSLTQQVSESTARINLQGLKNGIYLVKVTGYDNIQSLKIIKM
ncbi:T9SS type A sorting domain-containing protein [Flavobacterium sp. RHBU_24]|uniref:T9SS type A sorting domain-containing protein n=1 Tax=Flavobacterium sp. RHBU_24 TaxID=3391185 RepID=UPI003984C929